MDSRQEDLLLKPAGLDVKLTLDLGVSVKVRGQIFRILELGIEEDSLLAIFRNQFGILHRGLHRRREIGLAIGRRALRHHCITNELPEIFVATERLVESRHVLEEVQAPRRGDCKRRYFAAFEMATEFRVKPLRDIDIAADQGRDAGTPALKRNTQEFRAGIRLYLIEDVVPHAAWHGGDTDGVGLVFGGIYNILDRHPLVWPFGRTDPDERIAVPVRDRLQISAPPAALPAQQRLTPP